MSEDRVSISSSTEDYDVGQLARIEDGRLFRFCEAGATALVAGSVYQSAVPSANFLDEAVATLAADVSVLTGVGSTTGNGAVDLFKNGYVWVESGTGVGRAYRIKSNTLITAGGTSGTITLYTPLDQAIAAADKISYVENPWRDIIIHPSPPTAMVVGVAVEAIAANQYGWIQTKGPAATLTDGTIVIADEVIASDSVNGSVEARNFTLSEGAPNTLDGTQEQPALGTVVAVSADTEHSLIFWNLE